MKKEFINCEKCGTINLSEDVLCGVCGETLPEVKGIRKKEKVNKTATVYFENINKQKKQQREIIIVIIILIIAAGIYFTPIIKSKINEPDDSIVETMSENFVEDNLKAPSSATYSSSYQVFKLEYHHYKILSYVDSQNSFGAKIRSNYSAIMFYKGGEVFNKNNWELEDIKFY